MILVTGSSCFPESSWGLRIQLEVHQYHNLQVATRDQYHNLQVGQESADGSPAGVASGSGPGPTGPAAEPLVVALPGCDGMP